MSADLSRQIVTALRHFSSASRLYALRVCDERGDFQDEDLMVEAFMAEDKLDGVAVRDMIVLATNANLDVDALLGRRATLDISLADGSRTRFPGEISQVAMLGSDGALARYRLRLSPWLWRLEQVRNCRVWQDKTVPDIVDNVFSSHAPAAKWRWSREVTSFMARARRRGYCCQYRESDLGFVQRLLTEEGIGWRVERDEEDVMLVLFADSTLPGAVPEDPSSEIDGGIRFHNARAGERQDTVQALVEQRRLHANLSTVLSPDYQSKRVSGANSYTRQRSGARLPMLESFDAPGQYAYATIAQAQHYADLQMEAFEARGHAWRGRSTLRTLCAGTRLTILDSPLKRLGKAPGFFIDRVVSVGVNNMPPPAQHALAELFGPIPELLDEFVCRNAPDDLPLAIKQARDSGYGNCFEAIPAEVPWRPRTYAESRHDAPRPVAAGSQTAIVIGADGNDCPNGADELYCDRMGRVRIRFHWQDDRAASCWVRVAQRSAGGGMGFQFLPRIGTEVLVQFLEGDIDRPVIVGALYNGRGEGGVPPTPGGTPAESDTSVFKVAHDHRTSGQGNLAGGNSPVWHGASGDSGGHRNNGAQWGLRSKEFGGAGYNQLLFDDTDSQGRIQLKCSHAATELNLGHLIHAADNYRGSFRGLGAELRTDAYGAVRAGAGLLITSYAASHCARNRDPAGENAAGIALLKQVVDMTRALNSAAMTHQTVELAAYNGTRKPAESLLDKQKAPLEALWASASGMVTGAKLASAKEDAARKNTAGGDAHVPHTADPLIVVAAQGGLGVSAAQSLQLANGETVAVVTGQDMQFVVGAQMRVHSGQAIGMLGGAARPGQDGIGLQLIAARDAIDVQAQGDTLAIQARDGINVISANAHIDWAAAKSISLSTAGGANITISGGNITVQCPGKLKVHAGKKSFNAPARQAYKLPVLPVSVIEPAKEYKLESTFAFDQLTAYARSSTKGEFIAFLLPVFGFDIPAMTYIKLYDGLRQGTIPNAEIVIMTGGNYPAEFENDPPEIRVHRTAAERAVKVNEEAWELLAALLHEFGHYIDGVLRHQLADKNPDGTSTLADDSADDEGAKFASAIAALDILGAPRVEFAKLTSPAYSGPLRVHYGEARRLIMEAQDEKAQKDERKRGTVEYFPAGPEHKDEADSHGHENIESALKFAGNVYQRKGVLKQIYFGNWLRDNSQLLDPKVVRRPHEPKDMTRYLSRSALTRIVDIMGKKKFGHAPEDRAIFEVTEKRLGVYRACEHIDNPTNDTPDGRDPQNVDPDFEPRPSKHYLAVDPTTLMKRYIAASRAYMCQQITAAITHGPTPEGFRHLGAGLHVLEDYFAHSNFVELSLRKVGHADVLPWTSPIDGHGTLPVVTGMFASEDVVASMAKTVADLLFKVEWEYKEYVPGKLTDADEVMLILLEEHSDQNSTTKTSGAPTRMEQYKRMIAARDVIKTLPGQATIGKVLHYTVGSLANANNTVFNALVLQAGANVDDAQVYSKGDPNSNGRSDPSHSQLAKDHDTHHFHTLAAQLARYAITEVGKTLAKRWQGDSSMDPAKTAESFLVHPKFCAWQDVLVKSWADRHPEQVRRGASLTEIEAWIKKTEHDRQAAMNAVIGFHKKSASYLQKFYNDIFGDQKGRTK
jgi:type VI secretion system secreted protein VgrG